jgi:hypothetical protein
MGNVLLIEALRQQGEAAMRATPGVRHEWRQSQQRLALRVPAMSPTGFDIELEVNTSGVELRCRSMHTPLDDGPDSGMAIQSALGLLRDLLTPTMRLREKCANGRPYRWFLETASPTGWRIEYEMGLLLWNVFGRRSERTYHNTHLPSRDL